MYKLLQSILLFVFVATLLISTAMYLFAQGRVSEIGGIGIGISILLTNITLLLGGVAKSSDKKSNGLTQPPINQGEPFSPQLPIIFMAFNNQEFVVTAWEDMGNHWLLKGHITQWGSYSGVDEISFRVPKGIAEVRLGYYMYHGYVLVDISDPNDPGPNGYFSNTGGVWRDTFPYPKSQF